MHFSFLRDRRVELFLGILAGIIISAAVLIIKPTGVGNPLVPVMGMPALIIGLHYRDCLGSASRVAFDGLVFSVVVLFTIRFFQAFGALIVSPPIWDFQVFWISGSVAARGLDFYSPQSFHDVAKILNVSFTDDFSKEILDVGFWYPPMTMLLFLPLGWFNINLAALVWVILLCATLITGILLLWKLCMQDTGIRGLFFVTALTLMFPPIINNIWFAQTNFIVLLMLLLFWRDRGLGRAGVWLAISILVKPFTAVLLLFLLFKRRWNAFVYAVSAFVAISLLSLVVFGSATFGSFLSNPVVKVPSLFFFELDKGNLYAMIWRLMAGSVDKNMVGWAQAIFIGASVVLFLVTLWVVYKLIPFNDEWCIAVIASLGLLVYPNASTNYYSALLPVVFWLWATRRNVPGGVWGIAIFVGLEALLLGYNGGWSNLVFWGSVLFWVMPLGISFWLIWREHSQKPAVYAKQL
ncbi:MAG: DUF2029 domain-containing protein [Anaerolineales bacterium]|nr:DUF2029 domain-containing protein [Anaerolineales bacterium]